MQSPQSENSVYEIIVQIPNLNHIKRPDNEKEMLVNIIRKVKVDQIKKMVAELDLLFQKLPELDKATFKQLLDLGTLNVNCTDEQYKNIFNIQVVAEQNDLQLKEALEAIEAASQGNIALFVYKLRHCFYLNKLNPTLKNRSGYPSRLTDKYLNLGVDGITGYFVSTEVLEIGELNLLKSIYEFKKLAKNRVLRRRAHADLGLSLPEVQGFIVSYANAMLENHDVVQMAIDLSPLQLTLLEAYSKAAEFSLVSNLPLLFEKVTNREIDVNSISYYDGTTLLMQALMKRELECVKYLLSRGADQYVRDHGNNTVLHYIADLGTSYVIELFDTRIAHTSNQEGCYPIHIAAQTVHYWLINKWGKYANIINLQNAPDGDTALHILVRFKESEAVRHVLLDLREQIQLDLTNAAGETAYKIATDEIKQIIGELVPVGKSLTAIKPVNAVPAKVQPNIIQVVEVPLETMICSAKRYQQILADHKASEKVFNPFIRARVSPPSKTPKTIREAVRAELDDLEEQKRRLEQVALELQNSGEKKGKTYAAIYKRVHEYNEMLHGEGISPIAFSYELVKLGFIQPLIDMQDNLTPMQVAIDGEDVDTVKELLNGFNGTLNRESYKLAIVETINNQNNMKIASELEYAIYHGKESIVAELIKQAKNNAAIKLGNIPEDAVAQVRRRRKKINKQDPAFREAREHLGFSPVKADRKSWRKLLHSLQNTVGDKENAINGLFRQDEYPLVKTCLADSVRNLSAVNKCDIKYYCMFILVLAYIGKKKIPDAFKLKWMGVLEKVNAKQELAKKALQNILKKKPELAITSDHPAVKNVAMHATNNAAEIKLTGKLISPYKYLTISREPVVIGTPAGVRRNIFLSQNSPLAEKTPFREETKDVVNIDIVQAVKNKKIDPSTFYTTPHVSGYAYQRCEKPILFIGENPKIVTAYRISHVYKNLNGQIVREKIHQYDYYRDGQLVGSLREVNDIQEEVFRGKNIKATTYRLIDQLRKIEGPFLGEESYSKYVRDNWNNEHIINSAKAQIFNVLTVEAKITTDIDIEDPSVEITSNERYGKKFTTTELQSSTISDYVKQGEASKLETYLLQEKIDSSALTLYLANAVHQSQDKIVKVFLDYGVDCTFNNNQLLREGISILIYADHNTPVAVAAQNIITLLLQYGHADKNDPKHIRHAVCPDSFSTPPKKDGVWSVTVENDKSLISNILFHLNPEQARQIINCISRHIDVVHIYSFMYGLDDIHQMAVERSGLENLNIKLKNLFDLIDNNLVEELQRNLDAINYSYKIALLTHTIRNNNHAAFNIIRNKVNLENSLIIELCVRHDNVNILELVMDKYAPNDNETMRLWKLAQHFAGSELQLKLLALFKNGDNIVVDAIRKNAVPQLFQILKAIQFSVRAKNRVSSPISHCFTSYLITALETPTAELISTIYQAFKLRATENEAIDFESLVAYLLDKSQEGLLILLQEILKYEKKIPVYFADKKFYKAIIQKLDAIILDKVITLLLSTYKNVAMTLLRKTEQKRNYCHFALGEYKIESVRVLHKHLQLPLFSRDTPATFLYKHVHQNCKNDVAGFNLLLDTFKVNPPEDLKDRIDLLCSAVCAGETTTIKWLFEKGILKKDEIDEAGNNYILILYKLLRNNISRNNSISINSLNYLCDEMEVDINHKNVNGESVITLITYLESQKLIEFIAGNKNSNFSLVTTGGNTFLHNIAQSLTVDIIDQYVANKGDIHALNLAGFSAYTSYMRARLDRENITTEMLKFRSLKCQLRPYFVNKLMDSIIVINLTSSAMKILVSNKGEFIVARDRSSYSKVKVYVFANHQRPCSEFNMSLIVVNNDKTRSTIFNKNSRWVALPQDFQVLENSLYIASNGEESFTITEATKMLLELVATQMTILSDELYTQLSVAIHRDQQRFEERCQLILNSNESTVHQPTFLNKLLVPTLPFELCILSDGYYLSAPNLSPLAMAAMTGQRALVEFFLHNIKHSKDDDNISISPLFSALRTKQFTIAELLIDKMAKITYPYLLLIVEHAISKNCKPDIIKWVLEIIMKKHPKQLSKYQIYLTNFLGKDSINSEVKCLIENILHSLGAKRKTPSDLWMEKLVLPDTKNIFFATSQAASRSSSSSSSTTTSPESSEDEIPLKRQKRESGK